VIFDSSLVGQLLPGVAAILAIALAIVSRRYLHHRQCRRENGRGRPWKLRRVPVHEVDPVFAADRTLGYTHDTEVSFISVGLLGVVGVTSDYEAWILAVLARRAMTMFEFGTCTGRTAYLWARNSPDTARVHTITLRRDQLNEYRACQFDHAADQADAISETFVERFLYTGTDVEHKVVQHYGDSKEFDEAPLLATCDLIFIDGSHARSYVESDSAKALRMIRPGGLILWHDYRGPRRSRGVFETLNELAKRLPLVQIEGTSLVAYRSNGWTLTGKPE
jgi:predicted O-methyltransferase YrrM